MSLSFRVKRPKHELLQPMGVLHKILGSIKVLIKFNLNFNLSDITSSYVEILKPLRFDFAGAVLHRGSTSYRTNFCLVDYN